MCSVHIDGEFKKIVYTLSVKRYTHFKSKIFKICMLLIILFKCEAKRYGFGKLNMRSSKV